MEEQLIRYNLYFPFEGEKIGRLKFTLAPPIEHLRYELRNNPKSYAFQEFSNKIFKLTVREGEVLTFYLVNSKTGQKSPLLKLNIFEQWKSDEPAIEKMGLYIDISKYLNEIGL